MPMNGRTCGNCAFSKPGPRAQGYLDLGPYLLCTVAGGHPLRVLENEYCGRHVHRMDTAEGRMDRALLIVELDRAATSLRQARAAYNLGRTRDGAAHLAELERVLGEVGNRCGI